MAVMQALLKIKADVQGQGQVQALGRAVGGIQTTAAGAAGGLKSLTAAAGMGGLAGAMGTLAPLLSVAGLAGMAKSSLDAGAAMYDMAQKTGVSVESLAKFKKAASTSGTDLDTVAKSIGKLSKGLVEAGTKGTGATADALKQLGISATDASGKVRNADLVMLDIANKFKTMPDGVEKTAAAIALFGRSGAEMIPMLNMGGDAIDKMKVKMTAAFAKKADEYKDKLTALSGKVGALGADIMIALLPALTKLTDGVTVLVDAFNKLPAPLRTVVVSASLIAIAWGPITGVINGVAIALGALAPATAAIVPVISAAFTGLLTFLTGTVLPALLAFFSGPVGWTVLAVAAVTAMVILFRKPLGRFLTWLWEWGKPIRQFWLNLWNGAAGFAKTAFELAAQTIKNIFRGILQFIADRINVVSGLINLLIKAYNKLPAPDIGLIPPLAVPKFARGGFVNRPTLGLVGEAGREYIIPESKMAAASSSFLAGARGSAVLAGNGGKAPVINITTGPVMEFDGQRYVTVTDMERAMRLTAEGVLGRIRTPAARTALGIR